MVGSLGPADGGLGLGLQVLGLDFAMPRPALGVNLATPCLPLPLTVE